MVKSFPLFRFPLGDEALVNSATLCFNSAMFGLFRPDPIREAAKEAKKMLQIPVELIATTGEAAGNAYDGLYRANLRGRFDENALFEEICAFHVNTVITAMNRVAGVEGGMSAPGVEEAFERNANFLVKAVPQVLDDARKKGIPDTGLFKTLTTDKTLQMAAAYYAGMLEISDNDVLDFGRKYNSKLLSLSSDDRGNSVFAYIIKAVRIAHIEDLPSMHARTSAVALLNDTLFKAVWQLESKVEKFAPNG